jgi:hypothetical protein
LTLRKLFCAALLLVWFCYFTLDSLGVNFAPDDMMNIAGYWRMKPATFAVSHVLLWRNFYRPMGGLFYLPLFRAFGFNPAPYHAVILAILLFNVWLVYRLATLLRAGPIAAGLAALLSCYHASLSNLTYNIAFVYDVLCGCFYLSALVYYLRIRESGRRLRGREIAAFLALYVCALNSKEMAVTLPVVLLIYEWLYQDSVSLRGVIASALLNFPYVYGKVLRPDALATSAGYRPELSWTRILDFQTRSFTELFQQRSPLTADTVAWIWVALFYLAFRRRRPVLQFCWLFLAIAPLPIEFLPGRGGACLYLPFVGCAIFASVVAVDLAEAAARFLASEPLIARLGYQRLFAVLLVACVVVWGRENRDLKRSFVRASMDQTGVLSADVIRQMEALAPRTPPHSTVVFLDDPFVDWDMAFIAELWFRDRTVQVRLHRKTPLSDEEIAHADRVFDFHDGRLVAVR